MLNELYHESVPVILHEDDLNAMSFSIENRSPFLDRKLVEFCQTIPTDKLIRGGRAKAVLREAVRGLASDSILDNPRKVGFNVPISDFLNVQDTGVIAELLSDSPIFDIVKKEEIKKLLLQPYFNNSRSKFLFNFVSSRIFLEEFS
jgi:asparagine synthase (glutamine-hydrolysing)